MSPNDILRFTVAAPLTLEQMLAIRRSNLALIHQMYIELRREKEKQNDA